MLEPRLHITVHPKPLVATAGALLLLAIAPCVESVSGASRLRARQDDQHGDSDSDSDTDSDSDGPGNSPRFSSTRSHSRTATQTQSQSPNRTSSGSSSRTSTGNGSTVSSTSSSSANLNNRGGSGPGTGGIVGIIIGLLIVLGLASFAFIAWRRHVRRVRAKPRGTVLLTSFTGSPQSGSSYNAAPTEAQEMTSRSNEMVTPIAAAATTSSTTSRRTTSVSDSTSPLLAHSLPPLPPALSNPYDIHSDSHHDNYNAEHALLGSSPPSSPTGNTQPYTYEESLGHTLSPPMSPQPGASRSLASSSMLDSSGTASSGGIPVVLASVAESSNLASDQRHSQLLRDMAVYQKRLEAEDKRVHHEGGPSPSSAHPSGDPAVAIVDPPPVYSQSHS